MKVKKVQAYQCGKCSVVRLDRKTTNACCNREALNTCSCGAVIPSRYRARCDACEKQLLAVAHAKHLKAYQDEIRHGTVHTVEKFNSLGADYLVYWENGPNDGWFDSVEDALDYACQDDRVPPTHFRLAKKHPIKARADEHIDSVLNDVLDDYDVSRKDREELQGLLDGWWEKQCLSSYDTVPRTFVALPEDFLPETREVTVEAVDSYDVFFVHYPPGLDATRLAVPRRELPFDLQPTVALGEVYRMTASLKTFRPASQGNHVYIYTMELT